MRKVWSDWTGNNTELNKKKKQFQERRTTHAKMNGGIGNSSCC